MTHNLAKVRFQLQGGPCDPVSCNGTYSPVNAGGNPLNPGYYTFWADMQRPNVGTLNRVRYLDASNAYTNEVGTISGVEYLPSLRPSINQVGGSWYRDEANKDFRRSDPPSLFRISDWNNRIARQTNDNAGEYYYFGETTEVTIPLITLTVTAPVAAAAGCNRAQIRLSTKSGSFPYADTQIDIVDSASASVSIPLLKLAGEILTVTFFAPSYNVYLAQNLDYCTVTAKQDMSSNIIVSDQECDGIFETADVGPIYPYGRDCSFYL